MYDLVLRNENSTGEPAGDDICSTQDPGLYIQIMGTVVFVVVWPFIVLDMKWFPLGRPAACLDHSSLTSTYFELRMFSAIDG